MAISEPIGTRLGYRQPMTARSARAGERYFHVMSFVFLLTVFAGFARTLYLRPLFEVPEFPAVLLAVHG